LQGEDDGTSILPVPAYLAGREGEKPVGVYALYDSRRNLQYVGYGRNVVLAVRVSVLRCAGWAARAGRPGRAGRSAALPGRLASLLPARLPADPCTPPACLQGHLARVGEERCAFVRAMVFANRAMQSRAALQREADNWLGEAGTLPPGNGAEAELWEGATAGAGGSASLDTSLMTPAELAEYEEKKLKMRKVTASSSMLLLVCICCVGL
jgi:hypothetical protein